MRFTGWLLAATVMVTPAFARANATLDKPHEVLGHGVSLVVAGRYAEAEKPLRESLRLDPTLAEGHYNLAIALRNEGRFDDAIAEYHRALDGFTTEPDRAKALYGIGMAREARGDKGAWDEYLAFARPLRNEQPAVRIAQDHRDVINGIKVPGTYQKASR
jgi:Flp pilus assembly protein TadD